MTGRGFFPFQPALDPAAMMAPWAAFRRSLRPASFGPAGYKPPMTPAEAVQMNLELWRLGMEASAVIGMRMLGFAGFWNLGPAEASRMVSEKLQAFGAGALAGTAAALKGRSPRRIANASLAPVTRRARANRRRLSKSGPKGTL